jgi:hypothetical protein
VRRAEEPAFFVIGFNALKVLEPNVVCMLKSFCKPSPSACPAGKYFPSCAKKQGRHRKEGQSSLRNDIESEFRKKVIDIKKAWLLNQAPYSYFVRKL